MKPGDLVRLGDDVVHILSRVNQIGNIMSTHELIGALVPQDAVLLVVAVIDSQNRDGPTVECLVLGPEVLGWTYADRLEAVR